MNNFIEELKWRGLLQDTTAGTPERLASGYVTGYVGFDPTAPSLHIGNLVAIMLLVHFQRCGHKPIALVGGATGMIGDPSGKSAERNLLSEENIRYNESCIKKQLEKFLDFTDANNGAEIVNNYDWFKSFGFIPFLRDVGKHLTVNYMMAKDSVKTRLETGLSYTEFTYQLMQGYDFYHLYTNKNCVLQMGGSDQWGNITSGTELVRRMAAGEACALTAPLLLRKDGKKFGKSESGENVWLEGTMTSPYKFYQFWLNTTDEDAVRFVKIFSIKTREEVEAMIVQHAAAPHERTLQKALAQELTVGVHSQADWQMAVDASAILFGQGTTETLKSLSESDFLSVFEGVPQVVLARAELDKGIPVVEFLSTVCQIFPSKGEAKRMLASGGVSINKQKIEGETVVVNSEFLLNGKFIVVQKGKKNYWVVTVG